MKKEIFLIISFWGTLQAASLAEPIAPANTVFAFDLHHVLVKPDYKERLRIFWQSPEKWTIIRHLLNPLFLRDIYCTFYNHGKIVAYERGIQILERKYPGLRQADATIVAMANAQKPIPESFALVNNLKQQGFRVYLLSNIGECMFALLKKKKMFEKFFAQFDGFAIAERLNCYIQKPALAMYEGFIDKFNLRNKHIIFVDDLLPNIKGAEKAGINGIQFKTPAGLINAMQQLNVIATPTI